MNAKELYQELQKAYPYVEKHWGMQNNRNDFLTNFIYQTETFDETKRIAEEKGLSLIYVMHRWYNFHTSTACEKLMCEYGCIPETDKKNKTIDLYHNGIPYDVKLTIYPKAFETGVNLDSREGKNRLIEWLYANQSQQGRKHLANRLFIVCVSKNNDYKASLKLKANFEIIDRKVKEYIDYYSTNKLNEIDIFDSGKKYHVYSDIIVVKED